MPEGDTVLVTARRLHEALAGRRLLATDFRMPRYATTDLSGQSVREAIARGKHLLMRTSGDVTIHSHLRMDGEWQVHPPGGRWRGPSHEVRVVLRTKPWIAVGFRLGELEVLPTTGESVALGHLGPDVLGSDCDVLGVKPALGIREVVGIDDVAGGESADARTDGGNGSRSVRAKHKWKPRTPAVGGPAVAHVGVPTANAGGVHGD